ncbi:MAG: hypothetical protein OXC00_12180, partial [Acidimicrobiaceae bacterium]|nr:hypothetical protein [Acidimicrobiaceae bacterium]
GGGSAACVAPPAPTPAPPGSADPRGGPPHADVDLSLIPLSKMATDPSGHYSRPDATRLLFDKRPQPAVEMIGEQLIESAALPATGALAPDAPSPAD